MQCLKILLLFASVVNINAGYDHTSTSQGYYYPSPVSTRMAYAGSGMNPMTTYATTGNSGQDLKAYASQPQEYSSANYASATQQQNAHSSGSQTEAVAGAAATSDHSGNGHNSGASYAAGNNIYGANSEQFLPAYTNGGYEDNHLSSASNDYNNAGYSNEYYSNGYDKFQPAVYSNFPSGQYSHGGHSAGRTAGAMYDASMLANALAHFGGSQIQPQFTFGKTEAIPVSKHVQITKHIPVPVYKQIHIPYQKPVKVQIPHPILVPVPQPYPIQVPFNKPYAVPMVQEITIPIEKVVPYAIEKKIPYTIEKHVPYPVEKHVTVNVPHPYPVRVPIVKTVLHKVKSHGWY